MLRLEIMVNGEPYCVAGRHDAVVGAGVSHEVNLEPPARGMKVSANAWGPAGFEHWGGEQGFLKLGDVVTVRVVEREAADAPEWRSTEMAPFRTAPAELFQSTSHGVEGELLLWLGLIFGAVLILLFG